MLPIDRLAVTTGMQPSIDLLRASLPEAATFLQAYADQGSEDGNAAITAYRTWESLAGDAGGGRDLHWLMIFDCPVAVGRNPEVELVKKAHFSAMYSLSRHFKARRFKIFMSTEPTRVRRFLQAAGVAWPTRELAMKGAERVIDVMEGVDDIGEPELLVAICCPPVDGGTAAEEFQTLRRMAEWVVVADAEVSETASALSWTIDAIAPGSFHHLGDEAAVAFADICLSFAAALPDDVVLHRYVTATLQRNPLGQLIEQIGAMALRQPLADRLALLLARAIPPAVPES